MAAQPRTSAVPTHPGNHTATLWLLIFAFAALILGGGAWLYERETQRSRAQKLLEIESIATLKVGQIASWRQERLMDADSGARWLHFVEALRASPDVQGAEPPARYERDLPAPPGPDDGFLRRAR
jgi:hypothetical protein